MVKFAIKNIEECRGFDCMIVKKVTKQDVLSSMSISFALNSNKILLSSLEKVPIGVLSATRGIPFDIYAQFLDENEYRCEEPRAAVVCPKNRMLSKEQIGALKDRGINIYVHKADLNELKNYLKDSVKGISRNKDIDRKEKSLLLSSTAAMVMSELFENAESKEAVGESKVIAAEMLDDIMRDNTAFLSMVSVLSHDYYTYSHCVNVCVYAVSIGKKLGIRGSLVEELAHGAILHDLGKAHIDPLILNKQGKLTQEEFEVMKTHPDEGVNILAALGEKNQNILDSVHFHHEKVDASGYPKALKKETLPRLAQIVAVADIFDALTTKRSYKEAMSSFAAIALMKESMAQGLSEDALGALVQSFHASVKRPKEWSF